MPIPLKLSNLPPISSAGILVDPVDFSSIDYAKLFGDDFIPVLHLSGSQLNTPQLVTYKTTVSALTSQFQWEKVNIFPQYLSQGGFFWTTTGDLSTFGGLNVVNTAGIERNIFLSAVGIFTEYAPASLTIKPPTTAAIFVRSDDVRGPQLVFGLDMDGNHGSIVQAGKFGGFRFPRPIIFRLATPTPSEVMRLSVDSYVGINNSEFPPTRMSVRGSVSGSGGLSATGPDSVSYFAGPLYIGSNKLLGFPQANSGGINSIEALVVGGGGGGGGWGGGGGGGAVVGGTYTVTPGTTYNITVGAGGARGTAAYTAGGPGGESSITTGGVSLVAAPGGGGGGRWNNGAGDENGGGGSSGGGGSGNGIGGTGITGLGFGGGSGGGISSSPYKGHGGGGGAGGPGQNGNQGTTGTIGGNGGIGVISNITGSSVYYGGGGGGHSPGASDTGFSQGGLGGGGYGGRYYAFGGSPIQAAGNGTPNTGGGGGGSWGGAGQETGLGGSGVVIIRYQGPQRALGGNSVYSATIGSQLYTFHIFTTTGTSTLTVLGNSQLIYDYPTLTVIGNISATGTLSATQLNTHNYFAGKLGIGTNTNDNTGYSLVVIGSVSGCNSVSAVDLNSFYYFANPVGIGPGANSQYGQMLTVVGTISTPGTISATGIGHNYFAGSLGVGVSAFGIGNQLVSDGYGQTLTVIGNVSSTGGLSAERINDSNFLQGVLAIGDYGFGRSERYNTGSGFDNTVFVNLSTSDNSFRTFYGGNFTSYNGTAANRIVRLNNNGSIDNTFAYGAGFNAPVYALATNLAGTSLYVGGSFTTYQAASNPGIIRLNSTAAKDTAFVNGTGVTGGLAAVSAIAVDQFDGVYFGGDFTTFNGTARNRIVRVNSVGTIDASFNIGTGFNGNVHSIFIEPLSGKIYVGGNFTSYNGTTINRIVRLNTNGTIDNSFNVGTGFNDAVLTITGDNLRRVYVGGNFTTYNSVVYNRILRLDDFGAVDASFNVGDGATQSVKKITLLPDNNLIVAGSFGNFKTINVNGIVKTSSACNIDIDFLNKTGSGANASIETLSLDPRQNIMLGGNFTSFNSVGSNRLERLEADGTPDLFFHPPMFQQLTVQGSISSTGSLSAIADTNSINWLASPLAIGDSKNTLDGRNLGLLVFGSISAVGTLSAVGNEIGNNFNYFGGAVGIGTTSLGNPVKMSSIDQYFIWSQALEIPYIDDPGFSGSNIRCGAFGKDRYVIGADFNPGGYTAYSTNGKNWIFDGGTPPPEVMNDVKFFGRFVGVLKPPTTVTNLAVYADDGHTWSTSTLPFAAQWESVGFGNNIFIATATNGKTAFSTTSGISWIAGGDLPFVDSWSAPAYSPTNNVWFCTRKTLSEFGAYSFNNGITWTQVSLGAASIWKNIIYVPTLDKFLAVSYNDNKVSISSDGISWSTGAFLPAIREWQSIIFQDSTVYIISKNNTSVAYSKDLVNWNLLTSLNPLGSWNVLMYGAAGFVAITENGLATVGNYVYNPRYQSTFLTVIGNISSTGSLSAENPLGFNYFGGQVAIDTQSTQRGTFGFPVGNDQKLTVRGSISATGTLSATNASGVNHFAGNLGVGTNTFEGRDLRLTVIGNISSTGSLSAANLSGHNYFAGRVGIGTNSVAYDQSLTVVGSISATGSLSAHDTNAINFIGGSLNLGAPNSAPFTTTFITPAYNQKLTLRGNLSSTGALSATDFQGVNVIGRLGLGVSDWGNWSSALTMTGNISSTGSISAINTNNPNNFIQNNNDITYLAGQVGIGTNTFQDRDLRLTIIGNVSSTGSISAIDMNAFNYMAGDLSIGNDIQGGIDRGGSNGYSANVKTKLTVVGNISSTGTLSADSLNWDTGLGWIYGINYFAGNVSIGPHERSGVRPNLFIGSSPKLTVYGNIVCDTLSATSPTPSNQTYSYFGGNVGIGVNAVAYNQRLTVVGNISSTGSLSASDQFGVNFFASPLSLGASDLQGRNLGLAALGSVSATGSLSATGTDIFYLSGKVIINPTNILGGISSTNQHFDYSCSVFGSISANESLSARSIYVDPVIFSYVGGNPTNTTATLLIPTGFNYVKIMAIGGGGGGGSGRKSSSVSLGPKYGGSGGGGGGYSEMIIPLKKLSSQTLFITAGGGGNGGAAISVDNTNGANGLDGASSAISVGNVNATPILVAKGGRGGKGGTNNKETSLGGPAGGSNAGSGSNAILLSSFATATQYLNFTLAAKGATYGGGGGGSGGSVSVGNDNTFGLMGLSALPGGSICNNQITRHGMANIAGDLARQIPFGVLSEHIYGGPGGAGGGATITTTAAGAGGSGGSATNTVTFVSLGGGGGGGGASGNITGNSGAGGQGGPGYVRILVF